MSNVTIPNPPNAPAGYTAEWTGSEWKIVPLSENIVPAHPTNLPEGYTAEWNGSEWVVSPPVVPPAPSPDNITAATIGTAVSDLQTVAYLTTNEMALHITPESKQEVTDYIHQVANILAVAQQTYGSGVAYNPAFPPMPTALPQVSGGTSPYIQFVVEN